MITGKTNIVGLIGDPVEHSMSPPMHNAAFEYLGLDFAYVPFNVKTTALGEAIKCASALGIKGLNVTIPHKTNVLEFLDVVDNPAELIGAVNTIKFVNGKIIGYNTDGIGAVRALEEVVQVKNKKVVLAGAGGAARAVTFQLILSGIESITIINRTLEKALKLKNEIESKIDSNIFYGNLEILEKEISKADILINTTPIGMYPHTNDKPLANASMMHSDLVVNDLVYNPMETVLLKEAEKAGAKSVSGLKMLLYQGAEAFKIWTGQEPPVDIMEKTLLALL
ncbi:MAG: shikimate dehydrogenase [Methanobacteriaceae archaeon]|jgi:shikimate dehydrogenase|nr:shikimate dehydrogenase [Methanobacteriaceae archaeon]MDO9626190.1 shikimate dehydrogenase [Methanobacteriaceae archaeon]